MAAFAVTVHEAVTIGVSAELEQALAFWAVRRWFRRRLTGCHVPGGSSRVAVKDVDDRPPTQPLRRLSIRWWRNLVAPARHDRGLVRLYLDVARW